MDEQVIEVKFEYEKQIFIIDYFIIKNKIIEKKI